MKTFTKTAYCRITGITSGTAASNANQIPENTGSNPANTHIIKINFENISELNNYAIYQ